MSHVRSRVVVLGTLLAVLQNAASANTDIPADYGYSESHPVLVAGLAAGSGPKNERAFLNRLRGPKGEPVSYRRLGSCCSFESPNSPFAMLDRYEVTYEGLAEPVVLYLNMYDPGEVYAPKGFFLKE